MRNLRDLISELPAEIQRQIESDVSALLREIPLRTLREDAGFTQTDLAAKLGTSQGAVSRVENRSDMLLSTFFSFVRALGADASLRVDLKGNEYCLTPHFEDESEHIKASVSFTIVREEKLASKLRLGWISGGKVKQIPPRIPAETQAANDAYGRSLSMATCG